MIPRIAVSTAWRWRLLAFLLAAYCLWPLRESLVLPGLPLTLTGLVAILTIGLAIVFRPSRAPAWMVGLAGGLLVVKIVVGPWLLPTGWAGRYYTNDRFEGPHEPSLEFLGAPWTRIDPEIDFKGDTFPVHFFNDLRYNNAAASGIRRAPALSVEYTGHARLAESGTLRVIVATTNGIEVRVDGTTVASRAPTESTHTWITTPVPLQPGVHRVDVRYIAPPGTPRKLVVTLRLVSGDRPITRRPLPPLRPYATTDAQESRAWWLTRLLVLSDLVVLGIVALCLADASRAWWRRVTPERPERIPSLPAAATLVVLGVMLLATFVAWDRIPAVFMTIPHGMDALGYEDHARYLVRGDWLLNWPENHLHKLKIPYTMGYTVMMAVTHAIFGESIWHVYFFQDWMLWAVAVISAVIATRLGGWPAGVVAFLIGAYLKFYFFFPGGFILRETFVVFTSALLVVPFTSTTPFTVRRAATAGALAGLNYFTDPPNLGALPLLLWFIYRMTPREQRARCLLAFTGAWLVFFLIIPVRNGLALGTPTLVPTQGPVTLWLGNTPPPDVVPHPLPEGMTYNQAVWTYFTQEPRHFMTNVLHKVCYALGIYEPVWWRYPSQVQHRFVVVISWICAAIALRSAMRQNRAALLVVLLAVIRAAQIVVFVPDDRYVVPGPMTLIPLTAVGLVSMWQFRPLIAIATVLIVGVEHYIHTRPELATLQAWPDGRLLGPASYVAERKRIGQTVPETRSFAWTFPKDLALWKPAAGVTVINDDAPVLQYNADTQGQAIVQSPPINVPAALVETIEMEAAFTGWSKSALLIWRKGGKAGYAYVPVDHTGVLETYRIPVWQSRGWSETIDSFELYYFGDTVQLKRFELMKFPDVVLHVEASH